MLWVCKDLDAVCLLLLRELPLSDSKSRERGATHKVWYIQCYSGRYTETVQPGLRFVNPCTDKLEIMDMRINVMDLERQVALSSIRM